ncbi:MAG: PKD domain-containing protein [bacterium]|nr:PKD domain-containing protein [bacterium]
MYRNIFFHKKLIFSLVFVSLFTLVSGCKMGRVNPYDAKSSNFVGKGCILAKGKVDIPGGASVTTGELIIEAFSDTCSVRNDSSFFVYIPSLEGFQLVTACFKTGEGNSVLLAYGTNNELKDFRFSSRSTAIALCLMSPLLAGASEADKLTMEQNVVGHADFNSLVSKVEEVIKTDPNNLSNYDAHSDLYNDATRIVYNILGSTKEVTKSGNLQIGDGTGNKLNYINSINLYYGYRRTDRGNETNPNYWVVSSGDAKWAWSMPPWTRVEVSSELDGNEENVVFLSTGFVSGFLSDRTRCAGAVENITKGVFMIVDIVIPIFSPISPSLEKYHSTLVAHQGGFLNIANSEIEEINTCKQNGDYLGIALAFLETQKKLWANEDFLNWLTSEVGTDIFVGFMKNQIKESGVEVAKQTLGQFGNKLSKQGEKIIRGLFKGIFIVVESGPKTGYFIYDLICAQDEMSFYVKQANGVPTVYQTMPPNKPNAPNGPLTGYAGTSVTFTAVTTDPDGDNISYEFEWGDGSQNGYSNQVSSGSQGQFSHTYSSGGTFNVKASARDVHGCPSDWSGIAQITISGGGGNNAPYTPSTPTGATTGNINTPYDFSSSAANPADPDGDNVAIRFDWNGDGTDISPWSSFVSSGTSVPMSHSWSTANTYYVKAQTKDINGATSGWSSEHQIVISGNSAGWIKTFEASSQDWSSGQFVQQTQDGGYTIIGQSCANYGGNDDVWIIKTDESGNKLWDKRFDGGGGTEQGKSGCQTSDGGYIICGWTNSYSDGDIWIIKTDGSGNKLWDKLLWGGTSWVKWGGTSVFQTSDGGYIICGTSWEYGVGVDPRLVKTDANGDIQWDKPFYANNNYWYAYSVKQTQDGGYIFCADGESNDSVWLIKADASGNKLWEKTLGNGDNAAGQNLQQTDDGGYIIVGNTINDDVWIIKADADGNQQWNNNFGGTGGDVGCSVQQTFDGGYIITGSTTSYGTGNGDVWIIKTDASGNKQWDKAIDCNNNDIGYSIWQTSDGGYIITGRTIGLSQCDDMLLIKTDASGNTSKQGKSNFVQENQSAFPPHSISNKFMPENRPIHRTPATSEKSRRVK